MSLENPFFCDRFTREEYCSVAVLRRGFKWGEHYRFPHYQPLILNPGGTVWWKHHCYLLGSSGTYAGTEFKTMDFQTAKWAFAQTVYAEALASTVERFPEMRHEWVSGYPNWRFLNLPCEFWDAADFMIDQAKRVCDSGTVDVQTGCSLALCPPSGLRSETDAVRRKAILVLDVEKLEEDFVKQFWIGKPCLDDLAPRREARFNWNEIAGLFHRPTLHEVEMLNCWDALPPARDIDVKMLKCISDMDINGAINLVKAGANINSFDKDGYSVFNSASQAFAPGDIKVEEEKRIDALHVLLDSGALINLAAYQECDALIDATLSAEPKIVQFLLEKGADPNYNPWPEDDPDVISQALDYAATDAQLDEGTPTGDRMAEIETMLKAAGAVFRKPTLEIAPAS